MSGEMKPTASGNPEASPGEMPTTKILSVDDSPGRGDVSATTIGRMLGLASIKDLGLLDGKIDLVMSKVNLMTTKIERVISYLGSAPTGKDLERIDVQIAALRTQLREMLGGEQTESASPAAAPKKAKIMSSDAQPAAEPTTPKE